MQVEEPVRVGLAPRAIAAAPTAGIRFRPWESRLGLQLLSAAVLLLAWAVAASFTTPTFFPGPDRVAKKIVDIILYENFFFHMGNTLLRVGVGFGLALFASVVVGVAMGVSRQIESFLEAWVLVGLAIPGLIWAVLMLMWFGVDNKAAIAAVFVITAPIVTMNLWKGTKAIDRELVEMAQAFRGNRLRIVRAVVLPQVLPYIFAASRFGFAYAWKVVVISEMFGLSNGVGYQINNSFNSLSLQSVLAWSTAFILVMVLIEYGFLLQLERRFSAWRPEVTI